MQPYGRYVDVVRLLRWQERSYARAGTLRGSDSEFRGRREAPALYGTTGV